MFEIGIPVLSAAVNTAINYFQKDKTNASTANSTKTEIDKWNPEGPSILTELWLLTLYPSGKDGTKIQFEEHHITLDCPKLYKILPQCIGRVDKRENLPKLVEAVRVAINICPPILTQEKNPENMPSLNQIYLGARKGLYKLADTYGYQIVLDEFKKRRIEDSLLLTNKSPEPAIDKTNKDYIARKAITNCINFIDRALNEGVKETTLSELSKKVRANWLPGEFTTIVQDMKKAQTKLEKHPNSAEIPCMTEIGMIQNRINSKIEEFQEFIKECTHHGGAEVPAAAAPQEPISRKSSTASEKHDDLEDVNP